MSASNAPTLNLPGYVLQERIGAGGYGEVWSATVPGGSTKQSNLSLAGRMRSGPSMSCGRWTACAKYGIRFCCRSNELKSSMAAWWW